MKKTILITAGLLLILIIGGVWFYLFMNGSPKDGGGIFSSFGFGDKSREETRVPYTSSDTTEDDGGSFEPPMNSLEALRKVATRPSVAAVFVGNSLRYVERGTGHIYEVSLATLDETLISGTTLAGAQAAVFSPNGNRVVITTSGEGGVSTLGSITKNDAGEGALSGVNLPNGAREAAFSETGEEVYYLVLGKNGSVGYAYDILEQTSRQLFSIPLRDIEVLWGEKTYLYTTPSAEQTGYVYRIIGDRLEYVVDGQPGLTATTYVGGLMVANLNKETIESVLLHGTNTQFLGIGIIPDKCVAGVASTTALFCGSPYTLQSGVYPDDWYKGLVALSDTLWEVSTSGKLTSLVNLEEKARQSIDVSSIGTNDDGTLIWMRNKNDDSLWVFDTTVGEP